MELTKEQREKARRFFEDNQLAPPYDHELDALAAILQYEHKAPQPKGETDRYQEMRAKLYMHQHPEATFEEALRMVNER